MWFNGAERSESPETYWFLSEDFAVSAKDMPSSLYLLPIESPKSRNFRLRCWSFACLPQQQKLDQQPLRHGKTLKNFNLKSKIYLFMFSFFLFLCSDYWNLLLLLSFRRLSSRLSLKASMQTFFPTFLLLLISRSRCCVSNSKLDTYFISQSIESFSQRWRCISQGMLHLDFSPVLNDTPLERWNDVRRVEKRKGRWKGEENKQLKSWGVDYGDVTSQQKWTFAMNSFFLNLEMIKHFWRSFM